MMEFFSERPIHIDADSCRLPGARGTVGHFSSGGKQSTLFVRAKSGCVWRCGAAALERGKAHGHRPGDLVAGAGGNVRAGAGTFEGTLEAMKREVHPGIAAGWGGDRTGVAAKGESTA